MPPTRNSLWWDDVSAPQFSELDGDATADVVVVGAGITGLTAALLLQESGKRVTVIEADRVASGVTGYSTAKVTALHQLIYGPLRKQYDKETAQLYADINTAAIEQVDQFVEQYAIDCDFERRPAYTFAFEDKSLDDIRDEVEAAAEAGLDASFTEDVDLPFAVAGAVRVDNQIMLDPRAYLYGLATAFIENGGIIYEKTRAVDTSAREPVNVKTRNGTLTAEHVVLATQIPFLDRGVFFARTAPYRSYLIAVQLEDPSEMPDGMYISAEEPTRSLRPAYGNKFLLIGGEGHKTGQADDTLDRYARLEKWARQHFAVKEVTHAWSAQDWVSVDRLPFVGPVLPEQEQILCATGFSKWGMSLGTAAGLLIRDRILGRKTSHAKLFDTTRTNLPQAAKELVTENLNVTEHFVGDRLKSLTTPPATDLERGSGGLVDYEGETVAAYRTEDGKLFALSPICTHLGCYVAWNAAEKSWDCPCHGSRFNVDGRVIQGPAVKNLERKS